VLWHVTTGAPAVGEGAKPVLHIALQWSPCTLGELQLKVPPVTAVGAVVQTVVTHTSSQEQQGTQSHRDMQVLEERHCRLA